MGHFERAKVFIKVAELSSFAEAARVLGLARSVVTRQIGELEDRLGVQLLIRTTRKVSLTQAGQTYLQRLRPVVEEFAQIDEQVMRQHDTLSGTLRLSAPVAFGEIFLPSALAEFQREHPDVSLYVELTDHFVDILSDGFDMALRISGPPSDVSTIWRKIGRVPRMLVASPDYLDRAPALEDPAQLRDHKLLVYTHLAGGSMLHLTDPQGRQSAVQMRGSFTANNGRLIVDMAAEGMGIALIPSFLINSYLRDGRLVEVLTEWSAPEVWITAYYPPYDHMPAKVRVFTDHVERVVARNPTVLE